MMSTRCSIDANEVFDRVLRGYSLRWNTLFPTWERFIPNVGTTHSLAGNLYLLFLNGCIQKTSGSLGERMRVSATMSWCFKTEKDLVDNIRKALNNNKELYVSFEWGEEKTEDKVIIELI